MCKTTEFWTFLLVLVLIFGNKDTRKVTKWAVIFFWRCCFHVYHQHHHDCKWVHGNMAINGYFGLGRALFMCGTFHILKNNKVECIELKEKAELRYLWDRAAGGYLSLIPVHSWDSSYLSLILPPPKFLRQQRALVKGHCRYFYCSPPNHRYVWENGSIRHCTEGSMGRGVRYIDEKLSKADKLIFLKLSATYRYRKMGILKLSKNYRYRKIPQILADK